MRICMISSAPLPPREGIGFYVWNLSRQLARLGHQVQIITRGRAGQTSRELIDGITIWRATFLPTYPFHVHLHGLFVDGVVRQLLSQVDLFHLHTPLVKAPNTRVPTLVTVHTPMKTDAGAIPVNNLLGLLIRLQAPVSYRLEQQLFDRALKLTAVATSVADELGAYQIRPDQIAVLGNGVDLSLFNAALRGRDRANPYFCTVGRLAPRKGLLDLVECAEYIVQQYPRYRFLIAGTGPLEKELRREIERRNLAEHVILLGHIADRTRLRALYQGAAGYIHAAHYEGLPTVLLEAMACACPVIATAVSGALDVVRHEQNGLLIPPRAPIQIAAAAVRLIEDPNWGEQLGRAARDTVEERFSWERVAQRYVEQYGDVLRGALA